MFLAERDSIVDSSKVLAYLQQDLETAGDKSHPAQCLCQSQMESPLRVVWCPDLDHGMVFDLARWRARLKSEVLGEARRMEAVSQ